MPVQKYERPITFDQEMGRLQFYPPGGDLLSRTDAQAVMPESREKRLQCCELWNSHHKLLPDY